MVANSDRHGYPMPRATRILSLMRFVLLLGCLALAGCATGGGLPVGARAVVSVPQAAFYKYGPAQTFGPDFLLNEGTPLTVMKSDFGYARVTTESGTAGYISNDDIKLAPPPPAPVELPRNPRSSSSRSSPRPRSSDFGPTRGSPLFESGDLPPLPESGADPKPAPGFRY